MFFTKILRGAVALSIATAGANNGAAIAVEQNATPMAATECKGLARTISHAVGIPLTTRIGKPDLEGIDGSGCLMSGRAIGLKANFAEVADQVNAVLRDWNSCARVCRRRRRQHPTGVLEGIAASDLST